MAWEVGPDKTAEAKTTFVEIPECIYLQKLLGSLGQLEFMLCDCGEKWLLKLGKNTACGDSLDCINRVTSVECVNGKLGCGDDCRNQRFQKHQYAPIEVFDADKKGYGVRARAPLKEGAFVYEYIGEVIGEDEFRQRMVLYDESKIKHFYFMMLTHNAFIDATKKGSLARFCNHSCSPNAFVDKWVVGKKLRMGIFAKRDIEQGEEITFDYNVDRYGAQSQPCYCGLDNCIGFMGGKTQTDAALLLPDGIAEALGVSPKQERAWVREHKNLKKTQQVDDETFNRMFIEQFEVQLLMEEHEVQKVMGALMKTLETELVTKLVKRIFISDYSDVQMWVMRFHGYKTFLRVLQEFEANADVVHMVVEILLKWPRVTKNKISSSQIEDVVKNIVANSTDPDNREAATQLLSEWGQLQMAYRIPKQKAGSLISFFDRNTHLPLEEDASPALGTPTPEAPLPPGWESTIDNLSGKTYYFNRATGESSWEAPGAASVPAGPKGMALLVFTLRKDERPRERKDDRPRGERLREMLEEEKRLRQERQSHEKSLATREQQLREYIQQTKQEQQRKLEEEVSRKRDKREQVKAKQAKKAADSKAKLKREKEKKSSKLRSPEQQWTHLLAKYVPNMLRKYEEEIGHSNVKGVGKDLVHILVEKELKKGGDVPELLDDKRLGKIKVFAREFMDKFLVRYRVKNKKRGGDEKEGKAKRSRNE